MKRLLLLLPLLALASCSKPPEGLIQLTCEGKHAEREREFIVNADTGSLFRYDRESDNLIVKTKTPLSEGLEVLWTSKREKDKLVITEKTQAEQAYLDGLIAERDSGSGSYYCSSEKCRERHRAIEDDYIQVVKGIDEFFRYSIDLNSLNMTVFFKSSDTEDKKWTESGICHTESCNHQSA